MPLGAPTTGRRDPCSTPHGSSPFRYQSSYPTNLRVRLCVQRRLACSAGDRPAGAKVRSPVVWIAGWRETETLKPIDKVSLGGDHKPPGRNNSERECGLENE